VPRFYQQTLQLSLAQIAHRHAALRPMIVVLMCDQRPNANDRVINLLREFVTEFGSDFILGLSVVAVR
jgi:hypothetical protein